MVPAFVSVVQPSDEHSLAAIAAALRDALHDHGVVVLRGAPIGEDDLVALGSTFGELVPSWDVFSERASSHPLLQVVEAKESPPRAEPGDSTSRHWHTDVSFAAEPSPFTLLACQTVATSGGSTEFADLRGAFASLSLAAAERVRQANAIHSFRWRLGASLRMKHDPVQVEALCARYPDVRHPLVVVDHGREALFLSQLCLQRIDGFHANESDELLRDLLTHATRTENVYVHEWATGDIVLWNNRAVMHRRTLGRVVGTRRLLRVSTKGTALVRGGVPG